MLHRLHLCAVNNGSCFGDGLLDEINQVWGYVRLCGPMVRILPFQGRGSGSIPGTLGLYKGCGAQIE